MLFRIVGKKNLGLSSLKDSLDLFKAIGVKKAENKIYNDTVIIDVIKKIYNMNFFTPDVHKITNSPSCLCL